MALKAVYTNHLKLFTDKLDELLISYNCEMDEVFKQATGDKILWQVEIYEVRNTPDKIHLYIFFDGEKVRFSSLEIIDMDTAKVKYSLSNIRTQVVLLESIEDCLKTIKLNA